MNDPNRVAKWLLIVTMVVLSLALLYPPQEKLKGGIDLVGGTVLLFEIDTTGLDAEAQSGLSTRVMNILKERVDPKGQLNLEWRPVGNARIEVRMPLPPKEAFARREKYNQALDKLQTLNVKRREVEEALNATGEERDKALDALVHNVEERRPPLNVVVLARDGLVAARDGSDATATEDASAAYEDAMAEVLATSMPILRLHDVLALPEGETREDELNALRAEFPSYDAGETTNVDAQLLTKATTAYDAWAENKADLEDPSDLKRRLRGAGVLEFRILADRDRSSPDNTVDPSNPQLNQPISKYTSQLARYGPRPKAGDRYAWFPVDDVLQFTRADSLDQFELQRTLPGQPIIEKYAGRYYVLIHNDRAYGLLQPKGKTKTWTLKRAYADRNFMTGENVVSFQLDPRGGQQFGKLTESNINRQLCINLDGSAISHATINERITEHCQISGKFSSERVNDLVRTLEAGSLPARLKETPLYEQTVGPSLGETNRRHGLQAAMWGGIIVAAFIFFYYGFAAGGIADIALALNILFVLGIMSLMQATFTLPGIAGMVLTVGMAIDANVLIFERIREERARGLIFKKALNNGYDKAFSAIVDSNLTTLITCIILGFVASEEIKGFAMTLGLGLATSMFTALFCTRLAFNTLIAKGWLKDLSMRRLIGTPSIDWVGLRRIFLPISGVLVVCGLGVFLTMAITQKEHLFGIEFLGGTSIQIDFKPGMTMSDEEVRDAITATDASGGPSAARWIDDAADQLENATSRTGESAGQFTMTSKDLSGDDLAVLMRQPLDAVIERDGISVTGHTATFACKPGTLTQESFREKIVEAAATARAAANKLRGARVQSVGELDAKSAHASSFEIVTVETNRALVQQAILAVFGEKLAVQRAIRFTAVRDNELTKERFFVIEADDRYLSDVLDTDANFDIRIFRGGVTVETILEDNEAPLSVVEFEARLREVGLQPEFEQFRTRESAIFPLGTAVDRGDGTKGYNHLAVCAVDESLLYEDDPGQWSDLVALGVSAQIDAALGSEKSLSKVLQFAPQIAEQARNRAVFAMFLALVAIAAYIWIRFGNKDYGFAVIVALVHDVIITLGLIGVSHFVFQTSIAKALLIEDFKVDLPMVAAILTVIGYSMNDTIVVFDRIRENRGRAGSLNPNLINASINQTLSRTILTSLTSFFVVFVLYVFGGRGVHGFAVALMIGIVTGTYSTIAIASTLVYQPRLLGRIFLSIVCFGLLGMVMLVTADSTARLVLGGLVVVGCGMTALRGERRTAAAYAAARA